MDITGPANIRRPADLVALPKPALGISLARLDSRIDPGKATAPPAVRSPSNAPLPTMLRRAQLAALDRASPTRDIHVDIASAMKALLDARGPLSGSPARQAVEAFASVHGFLIQALTTEAPTRRA